MFTTLMLAAMLALTAQPASHPSKPGPAHTQTAPPRPAPSAPPPQRPAASNNAAQAPAATGGAGQGQPDHSPAAQSNWDHRRAYYWQYYGRPLRRGGYSNGVSSGVRATQGLPSPPMSLRAVHNLDATVTVTWVMPGGVLQEGDVFEVGRRMPGQQDFWKIGETTAPRFVDRQLQTLTSGTQYAVAVRRKVDGGNVWSAMSAVGSTRPNHPLTPKRAQPEAPRTVAPKPSVPPPQTKPTTDAPPK